MATSSFDKKFVITDAAVASKLRQQLEEPRMHGNRGNQHAAVDDPQKKRSVYLSDASWASLSALAKRKGMNPSEWVRHVISHGEQAEGVEEVDADTRPG